MNKIEQLWLEYNENEEQILLEEQRLIFISNQSKRKQERLRLKKLDRERIIKYGTYGYVDNTSKYILDTVQEMNDNISNYVSDLSDINILNIFYIGIGSDKRPYDINGRNDEWYKVTEKYNYDVKIIHNHILYYEANILEQYYIELIGKEKLANKSLGGGIKKSDDSLCLYMHIKKNKK